MLGSVYMSVFNAFPLLKCNNSDKCCTFLGSFGGSTMNRKDSISCWAAQGAKKT